MHARWTPRVILVMGRLPEPQLRERQSPHDHDAEPGLPPFHMPSVLIKTLMHGVLLEDKEVDANGAGGVRQPASRTPLSYTQVTTASPAIKARWM